MHLRLFSCATRSLSLESRHRPDRFYKPQSLIKRRNWPSWFTMWLHWLSLSDMRIRAWLFVVMPTGFNPLKTPVYLNRSLPVALSTTPAPAYITVPVLIKIIYVSAGENIITPIIPLNILYFCVGRVTRCFRLFLCITVHLSSWQIMRWFHPSTLINCCTRPLLRIFTVPFL